MKGMVTERSSDHPTRCPMTNHPIQATELAALTEPVLTVDVGQFLRYLRAHIPQAVLHVDYDRLVAMRGATGGLCPTRPSKSGLRP